MNEVEQLTHKLAEDYFVKRDYEAVEQAFAPSISWIGTGKSEICYGRQQAHEFFMQEKTIYNGSFQIERQWYHTSTLTPGVVCVLAMIEIVSDPASECLVRLPMRFSVIYVRQSGGWKIAHLHNSVAYQAQGDAPFLNVAQGRAGYEALEAAAQKLARQQVSDAYRRDPLTDIYNMEGFVQQADALRGQDPQGRYAFVKFGINSFRYINQSCGFDVGDEVLYCIGKNLKAFCGPGETCGRVEKDVFALMLRYADREDLDARLDALREQLVDEALKKRVGMDITFTAGIYLPADLAHEPVKDMLDKALIAMQSRPARLRKSEKLYYQPQMSERKFQEEQLLEEAGQALRAGEFRLYIQPQMELATGRLGGGEALVRWHKANGAVLMPDQFIPLFERCGFILNFDFYMLEALCRQMRAWLDKGLAVKPISINQSRQHLYAPDYLRQFCAVVDKYAVPHELLVFELTEGAFVECGSETMQLARQLHALGFQLAIDDFGTGYASLHSVSRLAADILKIDRSLLENFETNRRGRVILQKVVEMARDTEMLSVCEGVETPAQRDYLKNLGCDWMQGFLYARPMPAAKFEQNYLNRKTPARPFVGVSE